MLSREEFQRLADVPHIEVWLANQRSQKTKRSYRYAVKDFIQLTGIESPEEFRAVTRAHVIFWRDQLKTRELSAATIRARLSALSSLFDYLCDQNAVEFNPVTGVARPSEGANEGKTPAIADHEAKALLDAPDEKTLKGLRDRAILSLFLFHGLRVDELLNLMVSSIGSRRGVTHLKIIGKREKIRYVPLHAHSQSRTSKRLDTVKKGALPCSCRSEGTHLISHRFSRMWSANTRGSLGSKSRGFAFTAFGQQLRPTHLKTLRTLLRSKSGSATQMSRPHGCTTGEK